MAVEPLAMCYPGLAGGTLRAATASIQNESKRLLISQDFLPQSVTTKRFRRTLRNKGFSKASVTTHRRPRAASRLTFQLVGRGRQRERDGDGTSRSSSSASCRSCFGFRVPERLRRPHAARQRRYKQRQRTGEVISPGGQRGRSQNNRLLG
jgi:hypothetical protein